MTSFSIEQAIEKTSKEDMILILKIAQRANQIAEQYGPPYDVMTADLDITNAHANCPLKLEEMLNADNGNFCHDVFGIRANINRATGQLENCFLPRFADLED